MNNNHFETPFILNLSRLYTENALLLLLLLLLLTKVKRQKQKQYKNLRLFLFLSFTRRDIISMRAVLFGLAPHGEVLGDERLHQAVHLGGLLGELLHLTARWAPRRGAAHHCSDLLSLERRNTSSSSAHWRLSTTTTTSALSG